MKIDWPLLKRVFPQVLAWAAVVLLSSAVALAQDTAAPAAGQRTDGEIEMDVVHALDASKALKNDLITAATIQSEVTLSGTVSSEASSELAESIASHVAGVTKVYNNLQVGNPQDAQNAQPMNGAEPGAQQMADNPPDESMAPIPPPSAPSDGPQPTPGQPPYPSQAQPQAQTPNPQPPPLRPQYAPVRPQYVPAQPAAPVYETPKGPVTIPQGTLLQLRTSESVGTRRAKDGEPVQFTVIRDVAVGGVLAIPRGATVHGVVTEVKQAGELGGSPVLALKLTSLDLGGQSYPLDSDQFKVKGPNKAGQTVGNAVSGAIIGTIIGCAVSRGTGCAIGAAAGAGAGTAASAASPGPGVWIPAEALVTFHLNTPLTVTPVNAQEAARLAQGLYQGGPSLYRRGDYPYGSPYYGAGYYASYQYYGYPPVYYRPYFVAGGFYYWR
ncbi:MAG TPA: BON domain-containing protein [Terracidiphilus sp.]|nr:BON domain-containing protein [Terracidiphilus sp.]